jgi:hypothetical protein
MGAPMPIPIPPAGGPLGVMTLPEALPLAAAAPGMGPFGCLMSWGPWAYLQVGPYGQLPCSHLRQGERELSDEHCQRSEERCDLKPACETQKRAEVELTVPVLLTCGTFSSCRTCRSWGHHRPCLLPLLLLTLDPCLPSPCLRPCLAFPLAFHPCLASPYPYPAAATRQCVSCSTKDSSLANRTMCWDCHSPSSGSCRRPCPS